MKSSILIIFIALFTCTVLGSQIFYSARLADFLVTLHAFLSSIRSFFHPYKPCFKTDILLQIIWVSTYAEFCADLRTVEEDGEKCLFKKLPTAKKRM